MQIINDDVNLILVKLTAALMTIIAYWSAQPQNEWTTLKSTNFLWRHGREV